MDRKPNPSQPSSRRAGFAESQRDAAHGLSLAGGFAFAVGLMWVLGRWVEGLLDVTPWGQIIGLLMGWVVGFLHVYYWTRSQEGS